MAGQSKWELLLVTGSTSPGLWSVWIRSRSSRTYFYFASNYLSNALFLWTEAWQVFLLDSVLDHDLVTQISEKSTQERTRLGSRIPMHMWFVFVSIFNFQAELFVFLREPIFCVLFSKQSQFEYETNVYWVWEAIRFWKYELNLTLSGTVRRQSKRNLFGYKMRRKTNSWAKNNFLPWEVWKCKQIGTLCFPKLALEKNFPATLSRISLASAVSHAILCLRDNTSESEYTGN